MAKRIESGRIDVPEKAPQFRGNHIFIIPQIEISERPYLIDINAYCMMLDLTEGTFAVLSQKIQLIAFPMRNTLQPLLPEMDTHRR